MSLQGIAEIAPSVVAELNYLAPIGRRPRIYTSDPPPNEPQTTAVSVSFNVPIVDARPIADGFTLDQQGFELIEHRSRVRNFYDDEEVKGVYYPEAEALLKQV